MNYFALVNSKSTFRKALSFWIILLLIFSTGCFNEKKTQTQIKRADSGAIENNAPPVSVVAEKKIPKKEQYSPPEINEDAMQKAVIDTRDSTFRVFNNIRADYRIIGYEKPDTNSRKMVLFSVFTSDVEGNPFHCPYGAYYDSALGNKLVIKYLIKRGPFTQTRIRVENRQPDTVYFQSRWVEFDQ